MKFRQSGIHDPNALDEMREIQPITFAKRSPLSRLDYLLRFVKEHNTTTLEQYVRNLQRRYEELTSKNSVDENIFNISALISDFKLLKEYPKLALSSLNYFLQTLQLPTSIDLENDSIKVTQRIQLQAFLYPKYQNLFALTNTVERNKAIDIYKKYHDAFMRETTFSEKDKFANLEELAEQWFQEDTIHSPGLIRIVSEVENGKLILRKDTCLWNDAIEKLDDTELKYYICCYGDYEAAKRDNKHFVMTMNHTIIEGHPYCDCVFHDTRISNDLSHPTDEFFSGIE